MNAFRRPAHSGGVATGIESVDRVTGDFPTGAVSEIFGAASSGRTSLLFSLLKQATHRGEACAVIDANDTLDVTACGADLRKLVWVRCGGNAAHALKAADLLVQGGGFRLIALDLGDVPLKITQGIPLSWWYRFRRAVENTPAALVVLSREPQVKQCASLAVEMKRGRVEWSGAVHGFQLLKGAQLAVTPRKPARAQTAEFRAIAI